MVFLHRIVPGGADRSYGIHVAQLAGLPRPVINRAQEILTQLEASGGRAVHACDEPAEPQQLALFPETNPLVDELQQLDLNAMMPVEALNKLFEWKARFGGGSRGKVAGQLRHPAPAMPKGPKTRWHGRRAPGRRI